MAIMNNKTNSTSRISLRHITIFRSVLQSQEKFSVKLGILHYTFLMPSSKLIIMNKLCICFPGSPTKVSTSIPYIQPIGIAPACFTHHIWVNEEKWSKSTSHPKVVLFANDYSNCFSKHDKQQQCLKIKPKNGFHTCTSMPITKVSLYHSSICCFAARSIEQGKEKYVVACCKFMHQVKKYMQLHGNTTKLLIH